MTTTTLKNRLSTKIKLISLIIGLSLIFQFSHLVAIQTEASQIGVLDGAVSLDKYYVDGANEVKNLVAAPGDTITVRLRYANISPYSKANVVITDALPDSKFSYITGSLKNCIVNSSNCTNLDNSLFSGVNLQVAPSTGFYGDSILTTSGNLFSGKMLYLHNTICTQTSGQKESFIQSADNSSLFSPNCSILSGSTNSSYNNFNLVGTRYLHQTICTQTGGQKESFIQSADNSATFTPNCSSLVGSTLDTSSTIDLFSNRYLHKTTCTQVNGEKEIFIQSASNSATFTPDCSSLVGSTLDTSSTMDLFYASNGGGYIEYKMETSISVDFNSPNNIDFGDYGFSPSLSSSDFSTFSDNMTNSLSIKVFCDTINPNGGLRNVTLSDVELRTNQDFRCNYQANICPIVFDDLNSNGQYDITDTRTSGIQVFLQSGDGSTDITSLTTTNSTLCFNNLARGKAYRTTIVVPPTGSSTTGGSFNIDTLGYRDTNVDSLFGYSNGSLILNVPPSVALPDISVSNTETTTSTNINPIQVIDTRLSSPGWTLTATVNDFTSIGTATIPVSNAFKNTPGSVQVNSGQSNGINIGNQKTISSTLDSMSIFSANIGASQGNFQISTNIELKVPAYIRSTSYSTQYTYTII